MNSSIRLDAAAVRVLAHPLRSRLLSALRVGGPATATELAEQLRTNTGATSYHLRKLESVGLVADTEAGEGRRRVWRASSEYHSWTTSDFDGDEDAATSLAWLSRDYVRTASDHHQAWLDVESTWPSPWRDALGTNDNVILVDVEQLTEFNAEVDALLKRWKRAGEGRPAARAVSAWVLTHPTDLDQDPNQDPNQDAG